MGAKMIRDREERVEKEVEEDEEEKEEEEKQAQENQLAIIEKITSMTYPPKNDQENTKRTTVLSEILTNNKK